MFSREHIGVVQYSPLQPQFATVEEVAKLSDRIMRNKYVGAAVRAGGAENYWLDFADRFHAEKGRPEFAQIHYGGLMEKLFFAAARRNEGVGDQSVVDAAPDKPTLNVLHSYLDGVAASYLPNIYAEIVAGSYVAIHLNARRQEELGITWFESYVPVIGKVVSVQSPGVYAIQFMVSQSASNRAQDGLLDGYRGIWSIWTDEDGLSPEFIIHENDIYSHNFRLAETGKMSANLVKVLKQALEIFVS